MEVDDELEKGNIKSKLETLLQDKESSNILLLKLRKLILEKTDIKNCSRALNVLGLIYFLYPKSFELFSDYDMSIIRNPIKRINFLIGIDINDEASIEEHNYLIDDIYVEEINNEIFETTHHPFMIDDDFNILSKINTGGIYRYLIQNEKRTWKLVDNGHGHFRPSEDKSIYLVFASDELYHLRQYLEIF